MKRHACFALSCLAALLAFAVPPAAMAADFCFAAPNDKYQVMIHVWEHRRDGEGKKVEGAEGDGKEGSLITEITLTLVPGDVEAGEWSVPLATIERDRNNSPEITVKWAPDSRHAAIVSTYRKHEDLMVFECGKGKAAKVDLPLKSMHLEVQKKLLEHFKHKDPAAEAERIEMYGEKLSWAPEGRFIIIVSGVTADTRVGFTGKFEFDPAKRGYQSKSWGTYDVDK